LEITRTISLEAEEVINFLTEICGTIAICDTSAICKPENICDNNFNCPFNYENEEVVKDVKEALEAVFNKRLNEC